MNKYRVAITKVGYVEVDAESRDHADEIARSQEADGCVEMDIEVDIQPVMIGDCTLEHWVRRLDDACNVGVYEAEELPGHFGYTGCEADDFMSLGEAVEAAVLQGGVTYSSLVCPD